MWWGKKCSMQGGGEKCLQHFSRNNLKRNNDFKDLGLVGIIKKQLFSEYGVICVLDSS
jgi:hypothetical protein